MIKKKIRKKSKDLFYKLNAKNGKETNKYTHTHIYASIEGISGHIERNKLFASKMNCVYAISK